MSAKCKKCGYETRVLSFIGAGKCPECGWRGIFDEEEYPFDTEP